MSDEQRYLSEEAAAELWKRAAEMQVEAARLLEAQSRKAAEGEADEAAGSPAPEGYSLTHVKAAAQEAGISPEFVEAALAEMSARTALHDVERGWWDRVSDSFIGDVPEVLETRRTIAKPPAEVYASMQKVLPAAPYHLSLNEVEGDPMAGGVLVFQVPGMTGTTYTAFMYEMWWADIKKIMISIHSLGGDPEATEIVARSSMRRGRRTNTGVGLTIAGAMGGGGLAGGIGAGMAFGTMLGLGGAILAIFVLLLSLLGSGSLAVAGRSGYRALYRYGLGRGTKALVELLNAVNIAATSGWGWPRAVPPPHGSTDVDTMLDGLL